jgi:hypothetical protein
MPGGLPLCVVRTCTAATDQQIDFVDGDASVAARTEA